jgi:hypothetical protein
MEGLLWAAMWDLARRFQNESSSRSILLVEHDLFGKPAPTSLDHSPNSWLAYKLGAAHAAAQGRKELAALQNFNKNQITQNQRIYVAASSNNLVYGVAWAPEGWNARRS